SYGLMREGEAGELDTKGTLFWAFRPGAGKRERKSANGMGLKDRIDALPSGAGENIRTGLHDAVRVLQEVGNVPGAIMILSRLLEGENGLLGMIASSRRHRLKGANLDSQIEELSQKGAIPPEIASDLHWIRIRANRARHNIERTHLGGDDADMAINRT